MPYGTLTLHGTERDVELELISHTLATRIIRMHTGRRSASEVFFRGDEIDQVTFDGDSGILSINFATLISIMWEPYPLGDAGVSPEGDLPKLSRDALLGALQLIVDRLIHRDHDDTKRSPGAETGAAPPSERPDSADGSKPARPPGPAGVPDSVPVAKVDQPGGKDTDPDEGKSKASRSTPARRTARTRPHPEG